MMWSAVLTQEAYSARMGWCGWKGIATKGRFCGAGSKSRVINKGAHG